MPLKTHEDDIPPINLTPMIDVIFNLIIFFMVCTQFTEIERQVDLTVPQVGDVSTLTDAPQSRVINVFRDGKITLDSQPVTLTELTSRLADTHRQYQQLGVVVRGDSDCPLQNVAGVLAACRQAGISEMGLSVRLSATAPTTQTR